MVRSLSVDTNTNRRNNVFFNLSSIIRNIRNNDTDRVRWRRVFLTTGGRLLTSNIERKVRETSVIYRERMAFKKILPNLKSWAKQIFHVHLALDRKDIMKIFTENIMKQLVKSSIGGIDNVCRAMEIVPKRK